MQVTSIAHQIILNECQTILLFKSSGLTNAKGTQGKGKKIDNQKVASNHTIIGTL